MDGLTDDFTPDVTIVAASAGEHGGFSLVQWLLECGRLPYAVYERWRYGEVAELESAIQLDSAQLAQVLDQVETTARKLQLVAESHSYCDWRPGRADDRLRLSSQAQRAERLGQRWVRPPDVPQLDLFLDGAAAGIEHDLLKALARRDGESAAQVLVKLRKRQPDNPALTDYEHLVAYARRLIHHPAVPAAAVDLELQELERIERVAQAVLRADARDFLAPAWRRLAAGLANVAYDSQHSRRHASVALARIPDWPAVIASLQREPALLAQPVLLQRLADACTRQGMLQGALLIWCHLFGYFADQAERLVLSAAGTVVPELWRQFQAFDEEPDSASFAGWILLHHPGLLHAAAQAGLPPLAQSPLFEAVGRLLQARQRGDDEIAPRRELQQHSPLLLRFYLRQREGSANRPLS